MIPRETLIGGVLAATDRLVQQAGQGDWSSVAKTVEQRRMFLEALSASEAQPGEHDFLKALRAAVAESEAAVAVMSKPNKNSPAAQISGTNRLCTK
ncbi:MAG: hypothetical protein H7Y02_11245, partial [Candidatus Obscuribacterales bacterium]|nr:hypothetical protein [Steroidobacteraceae bacterium]